MLTKYLYNRLDTMLINLIGKIKVHEELKLNQQIHDNKVKKIQNKV